MNAQLDLVIIGAGPSGLACSIESRKRDLNFLLLEKGCLVNSIYHYPENMTFFTTAELLEIGDLPMTVSADKPKRLDALKYYRRVVDHFQIPFRDYERVVSVTGRDLDFQVRTQNRYDVETVYRSRKVIIATGYFDNPNRLGVPGEDLPNVSHYYDDPHPCFRKKVVVIGGKNSAAIAALELFRNGAQVTLVHRGEAMGREVKYWILPDINNRIQNGEIVAFFSTSVKEIRQREVVLSTPAGETKVAADFVFALTGYHPDTDFLRAVGIEVDPVTDVPAHDPGTLESSVNGVYLAGSIISGKLTNRIFIENGRFHGEQILPHLQASLNRISVE